MIFAQVPVDFSWLQHGVAGLLFVACCFLAWFANKTLNEKDQVRIDAQAKIAALYEAQLVREEKNQVLLTQVRDVLRQVSGAGGKE